MDLHMEDALLTGLVVCGNCGRRLKTDHPAHRKSYYGCARHCYKATEQACFGLKAAVVDDLVRDQVLHELEPAAPELSCRALEDVQRDRARLDKHWKQRLERARYEADYAERRYRAVDPENQLVARSLEKRWEETLRAERQVRAITIASFANSRRNFSPRSGRGSPPLFRRHRTVARLRNDPPGSQGASPAPRG